MERLRESGSCVLGGDNGGAEDQSSGTGQGLSYEDLSAP